MAYLTMVLGNDAWSQPITLTCVVCLVKLPPPRTKDYILSYSQCPITIWIYNFYFHPLAKFPGSIFWRISRLPYMRAVWGKHFPYEIQKLHTRYGNVVRVAPNELSSTNPAAWDDICLKGCQTYDSLRCGKFTECGDLPIAKLAP